MEDMSVCDTLLTFDVKEMGTNVGWKDAPWSDTTFREKQGKTSGIKGRDGGGHVVPPRAKDFTSPKVSSFAHGLLLSSIFIIAQHAQLLVRHSRHGVRFMPSPTASETFEQSS